MTVSLLNSLTGGGFTDLEGQPLASGYLDMVLSHDGVFAAGSPETQVVAGLKRRVYLDNNGNIAGTVSVVANDQLLPASTYYTVNAYKSDGTRAWAAEQYWQILSSPSPFNVGTIEPTNPPASGLNPVSPSVLLNPSGNQVISADNLNPASANTTQSLGQAGSPWDATLLNVVIDGTLKDGTGSVGTAGQVLSSTGTETEWISAASDAFSSLTTGTNTSATMTVGTGATLTTSGTGVINASKIDGVAVTGTPSAGQVITATSGTAADWATPGAAFSALTSGSNTTATMTVGTGATLEPTGSGVIEANEVSGVTVSGTPSSGQVLTATSSSAADWQTFSGLTLPSSGLRLQFGTATGSGSNQPVSFPVAFSGTPKVLLGNYTGSADIHTGSTSSSGFALDYSSGSQQVDWLAIGPA
jgi:hypothetical protein